MEALLLMKTLERLNEQKQGDANPLAKPTGLSSPFCFAGFKPDIEE
jgi:hypothetical protein